MNFGKFLNGFDLDDNSPLDKKVEAIAEVYLLIIVKNGQHDLALKYEARLPDLVGEAGFVGTLQ